MDQRARVLGYVPGHTLQNANHGICRVLLQVFGMAGHGKSALINSCLCVVKNQRYQDWAPSGPSYEEVTKARQAYELTPHLTMIDNRGLNKLNGAEELEMSAQFRQLRSLGEVTWGGEKDLAESIRLFKQQRDSRPKDLIVPVFVYRGDRQWNHIEGAEIKKIITSAHQITGIQPLVVITHFASGDCGDIKARFMEFGCTRFVPMENYTERNPTRTEATDRRILELLTWCTEEAEPGIGRLLDQDPSSRSVKLMTGQVDQNLELLRQTREKFERAMKK